MAFTATTSGLIATLTDLIRLPAPAFVGAAYRAVLGRAADPKGFADALRRLERGVSKRAVLAALLGSDEARGHLGVAAADVLPRFGARLPRLWSERIRQGFCTLFHCGRPEGAAETLKLRPVHWPLPPQVPAATSHRRRHRALLTIAAGNYLPQIKTLMASAHRHHPDWLLIAVIVGDIPAHDTGADFTLISAATLGIDAFDDMTVRYDVVELCTAIKPFAIRYLFGQSDVEAVVYLDPDIYLFAPMDAVDQLLNEGSSVVVTPHITQPLLAAGEPNDHSFLKSGVFNLGFIAFGRCQEALSFIDWWADRLRTDAVVDFAANLFTDQRWCDLAPCFLQDLSVLRDVGYNVAYWNLEHRPPVQDATGIWTIVGRPLVFFHYSGLDPARPERVSRFQDRLRPEAVASLQPLLGICIEALRTNGWPMAAVAPYAYGQIDLQSALPPILRSFYRRKHPCPSPLARRNLLEHLLRDAFSPECIPGSTTHRLPALLIHLHQLRPDLQASFDLDSATQRVQLEGWFVNAAAYEYDLHGLLVID